MAIFNRVLNAWNAFRSSGQEDTPGQSTYNMGPTSSVMPYTPRLRYSSERTIAAAIYNRLAVDVAAIPIKQIVLDDTGRYAKDKDSSLNNCLQFEPNMDQSPRSFRQNIATTLIDKGVAAIVPVDTSVDPETSATVDIYSLRVGSVVQWYPQHVRVMLYNEATGVQESIVLEKRIVAIVENPFYSVMNEPNSTLQRLIRKLNLLDAVDEQSSSGKLDLIIQLPYTIKSEARRQQAEKRREDIEFQLKGSQYGIAYTDGTEKVTQLNRPADNNLMTQIEYLTQMLYGQLGLTEAVMNGTADDNAMNNYYSRTIEPILDSIIEGMQRAFLGISGYTSEERIRYFRNPFKFTPMTNLAVIADKFSRNEILSANEIRDFMGISPSNDPKADLLVNSNINPKASQPDGTEPEEPDIPTDTPQA